MRTLIICATLAIAVPAWGAEFVATSVSFRSAVTEPTPLARKAAQQRGETLAAERGQLLSATLYRPARPGQHPAVVLLHDCRGVRPYQRTWAEQLAEWGYVAMLIDSFTARGLADSCDDITSHGARVFDAYGAFQYLAARPFVDHLRIGIAGWAYDAVLTAVARAGAQQFFERPFRAAVAFYPDCGAAMAGDFVAPVMVLGAGLDDWSPPHVCRKLEQRSAAYRHRVKLHVYPRVHHSFDDHEVGPHLQLHNVRNLYRSPALGATLGYDAAAHQQALLDVHTFLEDHIRYAPFLGSVDDLATRFDEHQLAAARWIVEPGDAGTDLPARGYSTFDLLFTRDADARSRYHIPFPFARLLEYLDEQVQDPGRFREAVSVAIIPRGRSLQREVAAPDYYRYPRIVAALTREPVERDGVRRPLLRDRLFLGYVEKSGVLEVISFNAAMGRFEFQVVRHYREGAEPEVYYAPRKLCLSCHQNHAPIFPNAPWDETNANPAISALLAAQRDVFYGLPTRELGFSVNSIDLAANRANRFAVHDRLWKTLCEHRDSNAASTCRAALLRAALHYRLSGTSGFVRDRYFLERFHRLAQHNWQTRWSGGLKIPFANIPDRDQLAMRGDLPGKLDPLRLRPPETIWHWHTGEPVKVLVNTLGQRLLRSDMLRLDDYLLRNSAGATRYRVRASCSVKHNKQRGLEYNTELTCTDATDNLFMNARLQARGAGYSQGIVDWLGAGEGLQITGVKLVATASAPQSAGHSFEFAKIVDGQNARLPNADRLVKLTVTPGGTSGGYDVSVEVVASSAVLDAALQRFQAADAGHLVATAPLRPVQLTAALFASLGEPYPADCCVPKHAMPAPRLESMPAGLTRPAPAIALFADNCGACHGHRTQVPPGFLHGDERTVAANLNACAERINYRLHMWTQPDDERVKSPMPPVPPAPHDERSWPASGTLAELRAAARQLLTHSSKRSLQRLLGKRYDTLAACAPPIQ